MNPPPLRPGLIDTGLLGEIHQARNDAINFAMDLLRVTKIEVSEFSVMVLTAGCRDANDLALLQQLLRHNVVHSVTAAISRRALALLTALQPPAALPVDAAIVAATALVRKLPVYTLDPARFAAVPGLTTLKPY